MYFEPTCTLTLVWTLQKESDSSANDSIFIGSSPTVIFPLCMGRTEATGGGPLVEVRGTGGGPLVEVWGTGGCPLVEVWGTGGGPLVVVCNLLAFCCLRFSLGTKAVWLGSVLTP